MAIIPQQLLDRLVPSRRRALRRAAILAAAAAEQRREYERAIRLRRAAAVRYHERGTRSCG